MSFLRATVATIAGCTLLAVPLLVEAQQRPVREGRASDPPVLRRSLRGVLGGVCGFFPRQAQRSPISRGRRQKNERPSRDTSAERRHAN